MVIFFESGRLGNQLFQYCAMRSFQPDSAILAIGMDDLKRCFTGTALVNESWAVRIIVKIIRRFGESWLSATAERGLINLVEEVKTKQGVDYRITKGFLAEIYYFKAGYYQSETVVQRTVMDQISLREEYSRKALQYLSALPCSQTDCFFVHIRRGDYIRWPSPDAPAVLPLSWYRAQMQRIRETNPAAFFLLISDDLPYVEKFFADDDDSRIHKGDFVSDFAVMTQCLGGGVLSASSYSWWGGYFIHHRNPGARLIAPLFWAGHRSGSWFPSRIQTSWLDYVAVEEFCPCYEDIAL